MDALGAPAPDPDNLFQEIVANIDGAAIEQAVTTPEPKPEPVPAAPEAPATLNPVRELARRVPTPEQPPTPTPAPPPPPTPPPPPPLPPPVMKPERPALVEPTRPTRPDLGRAEQTGHFASITGYTLSVLVGAVGQILFLGEWLGSTIPAPGNWIAAAIGAAFAEVGMIGAGNTSLTKRRDGGRWKLLLVVACFVCAGAVAMQIVHWLPTGIGVALVFGLASFVGFLIHMVIEHSKVRDYEDRKVKYAAELARYRHALQVRYEEDRAEYKAEMEKERAAYAAAMEKDRQQRRQAGRGDHNEGNASGGEQPPRRRTEKTSQTKTPESRVPTKPEAVRIGVEQKVHTPAALRDTLLAAGYTTMPSSKTTLENWCKDIKAELGITS